MPRSLLIIDEFQEFFTEEDRVSQGAAVLLDRIVRQGRAFGIHVLLGSQTLGGAYTLARATIGQMVIRIALQCNEADAYLDHGPGQPGAAPALASGRRHLQRCRRVHRRQQSVPGRLAAGGSARSIIWRKSANAPTEPNSYPGPFVFEGNAPADVRENLLLNELLKSWKRTPSRSQREGRAAGAR